MNKLPSKITLRSILGKILQNFLQGLVVLAPIGITIWVVLALFNFVDSILPNILHAFLPDFMSKDADGNLRKIPGLGFIVVILIVLILELKFHYRVQSNKKKFDKPVLVNVDADNVWRVGFITQKNADNFEVKDHVVVYVPHSYAISGITYIVPRQNVRILNNISAADAMKFAVSGGVTDVSE